MPSERSSFYVYRTGYHQDMLSLGTLIWQDYINPSMAKRWSAPTLSEHEKERYAYVDETSPFVLHQSNSLGGGVAIETFAGPTLKFELSRDDGQSLAADIGRRVMLKDPSSYLQDILKDDANGGRKALTRWLTAARNAHFIRGQWMRRPKVWMLTGVYEMVNGRYVSRDSLSTETGVGVDSTTIMAASAAPIGGSIYIKTGQSTAVGGTMRDTKVWAAQYQRLNVRYFQAKDGTSAISPAVFELMPNVFSRGVLRSTDGGGTLNAAEILGEHDAQKDGEEDGMDAGDLEAARLDALFEKSLADLERWLS